MRAIVFFGQRISDTASFTVVSASELPLTESRRSHRLRPDFSAGEFGNTPSTKIPPTP